MRDICRNFQRGSCQYGEKCRYLHVQQQRKPNGNGFGGQNSSHQQKNTNPFGFGTGSGSGFGSQQQQKNNPFGFGTQNSSQLNGAPHSGYKPNQYKPFENKWTRQSSNPQNSVKSDNNSQRVIHKCTDPENCKLQIAQDFEKEKPLWILTCYSHCQGAPCDIVGDISYEELRASAYEDAKRGMSLQSIVEKERNILKSKLFEFEKLLSGPYKMPINSSLDSQNPQSIGGNVSPFSRTSQSNGPLLVSSFSQLGTSLNLGFERPSAPLTNNLVQPNFFGSGASNAANPNSIGVFSVQSSPYSTPVDLAMFPSSTQQTLTAFNNSGPTTMFQTTPDVQLSNNSKVENASGDVSISGDVRIWLKEKWNPGEIPEEAPPDTFVR